MPAATPALALLLGAALLALACPVRAHGDADWIERDSRYVDRRGEHCCGPNDCDRAPPGAVIPTPDGYRVRSTGQVFRPGDRGLYHSLDGEVWWCVRNETVTCLFVGPLGL